MHTIARGYLITASKRDILVSFEVPQSLRAHFLRTADRDIRNQKMRNQFNLLTEIEIGISLIYGTRATILFLLFANNRSIQQFEKG